MRFLTIVVAITTLVSSAARADGASPLVLHVDPLSVSGSTLGFDAGSIAAHLQQNLSAAGLSTSSVTAECTFQTPGRTNLADVGTSSPASPPIDDTDRLKQTQALSDLTSQLQNAKSQIASLTAARQSDQSAEAQSILAAQVDANHKIQNALQQAYDENAGLRTQVYTLQSQNTYLHDQVDKLSGPASQYNSLFDRVTVAEGEARKAKADLQSVKVVMPTCKDPGEEVRTLTQKAADEHAARENDEALIAELRHRLEAAHDELKATKGRLGTATQAH